MISETSCCETRQFRMHPKLLFDVIQRQAGNLGKAVLEGAMNAIDAKAATIKITVEPARVIIEDDGQGFPSREQIENFFEVFGQPHEESEGKTFATFRMGRGQMFAFGRNHWRSGRYAMDVDIKNAGLAYELQTLESNHAGCRIEIALYRPLNDVEAFDLVTEIKKQTNYLETPVFINGQQTNRPASLQKWDIATPEAFFNIRPGGEAGIDVFNLGAYTTHFGAWAYGASGVIVSRQKLTVNFARNDIMCDCPVWRVIRERLKKATDLSAPDVSLDDSQRAKLWAEIRRHGDFFTLPNHKTSELKLFLDSNRTPRSLKQIERGRKRFTLGGTLPRIRVFLTPRDKAQIADRVLQQGRGLPFSPAMGEWLDVREDELGGVLSELGLGGLFEAVPINSVEQELDESGHRAISPAALNKTEKLGLAIASDIGNHIACEICRLEAGAARYVAANVRCVQPGESNSRLGWTDGDSFIVIERRLLSIRQLADLHKLAQVLLHEYCHQKDSTSEDLHDFEFYRTFHEYNLQFMAEIVRVAWQSFESKLCHGGRRALVKAARDQALQAGRAALGGNG